METTDPDLPPPQKDASRCCFYLKRKLRYCTAMRQPASEFCGVHRPTREDAKGVVRTRIPCPFDPTHSIFNDTVAAHKRVCPFLVIQKTISELPCFREKVNSGAALAHELAAAGALHSALSSKLTASRDGFSLACDADAADGPKPASPSEAPDPGDGEHAAGEATLGKLQRAVELLELLDFSGSLQAVCAAAAAPWLLNCEADGFEAASRATVHSRRTHAAGSVSAGAGSESAVPPTRHELQAAAIVLAMQEAGVLPVVHDRASSASSGELLVIEAGAGSAALSEELVCAVIDSSSAAAGAASATAARAGPTTSAGTGAGAMPAGECSDGAAGPALAARPPPLRLLLLDRMAGITRRDLFIMKAFVAASGLPLWPSTGSILNGGGASHGKVPSLVSSSKPAAMCVSATGVAGDAAPEDDAAKATGLVDAAANPASADGDRETAQGMLAGYAARAALLRSCISRVRIDLVDFCLAQHPAFVDCTADASPAGKAWELCDPVSQQAALRPSNHILRRAAGVDSALTTGAATGSADVKYVVPVSQAGDEPSAKRRARSSSSSSSSDKPTRAASTASTEAPSVSHARPTTPRRTLLVAKHLCGAATDFALRSYAAALVGQEEMARLAGDCLRGSSDVCDWPSRAPEASSLGGAGAGSHPATLPGSAAAAGPARHGGTGLAGFGGVGLVTCCHHRCDWQPYVGKRFFREAVARDARLNDVLTRVRALGMTEATAAAADAHHDVDAEVVEAAQAVTVFTVLSLASSWGTTFDKSRAAPTATATIAGSTATPSAPSATATGAAMVGVTAAGAPTPPITGADKCEIGRACKLLIDAGRADFLRRVLARAAEMSAGAAATCASEESAGALAGTLSGSISGTPASSTASSTASSAPASAAFTVGIRHFCPSSLTPENRMLIASLGR